ncbi:GGDEF domain-containing protein [Caldimonas manganoxidans]|uniref:GGDEF domain-containing protein n=2 Tax=Caldimonas TaxID=196013 RepID=UPI0003660B43|nr:GGDEF domain-containing protein [Caldimonas manganoxidans]
MTSPRHEASGSEAADWQWDRWHRVLLSWGLWPSVAVLVSLAWLLAALITVAVIGLLGQGSWRLGLVIATACVWVSAPPMVYVILRQVFRLEQLRQRLQALAVTDDLTGCYNRRYFWDRIEQEWARAHRHGLPLAVLLIDVDDFKRINDAHGHHAGDLMLQALVRACGASLRSTDVLARYGGEELAVLLPQTNLSGALAMAERIRAALQQVRIDWQGQSVGATVSVGVAALHDSHANVQAMVHDADVALYEAKRAGRNRVHGAPMPGACAALTQSAAIGTL